MDRPMLRQHISLAAALAVLAMPARASITVPSDGSDGAFNPLASTTVDLGNAVNGSWDADNTANAGKGVYDAAKWAVVYKYSSVNIPSGVTVSFQNHPKNAPIVWLVQGNVSIAGTLNLSSPAPTNTGVPTPAGPGGFRGGIGGGTGLDASPGFGPGGGAGGSSGSYGTIGYIATADDLYGSPMIVPLLGGSGGPGNVGLKDGSGGGGAILIAAAGIITVNGSINASAADSAYRGGSGGAIRLVCDTLTGAGNLYATGGNYGGGKGRIRIEANAAAIGGTVDPVPSMVVPLGATPPAMWPAANAPTLVVTQVGGMTVPADPGAGLVAGMQDVSVSSSAPVTIRLQATNMPTDWVVKVRLVPKTGAEMILTATLVSGDATSSIWQATATLPHGIVAVTARAHQP